MRLASVFILSLFSLSAQQLPDGKTLVEREGNALQSYVSYQYTEETTMQMTVMGNPVNVTMTIEVQATKPNKLRMETKTGNVTSSVMISDGDTAWMYIPILKQYSMLSGNEAAREALGSQLIGDAAQIIANAVTRRSEAVDVDGMSHECWVVESRIARQSMGGMEIQDAREPNAASRIRTANATVNTRLVRGLIPSAWPPSAGLTRRGVQGRGWRRPRRVPQS